MQETGWYFAEQGRQVGPLSRDQLADHIRSGRVNASSQVWHPSMPGWALVQDSELATLLPQGSPPPILAPGQVSAVSMERSLPGASFTQAFSRFWRKYVTFSGRASRSEYWFALLGIVLLAFGAGILDAILGGSGGSGSGFLSAILSLAMLLPIWAISFRRLHDIDRTGWWLLIGFVPIVGGIVLLVFACTEGTRGANRFGA